ncbi:unnamed protein product [Zymoseptoria tritici ST99CH_1E4]|uniref:Uncharacterized protein n=1 Tax=Zymoseptoria tritici ST99CH_1E4 TaxID=1276532 RepID=A0A2H1G699_ZYMTR|nr:unnamed protein product [Zymoseptoria tritici ST99CH_1E4]
MGATDPAARHGVRNSVIGLVSIAAAVVFILLLSMFLQRRKNNRFNPPLPVNSPPLSAWGKVKEFWSGANREVVVVKSDVESQMKGKQVVSGVTVPAPTFLVTRPTTMGVPTPGPGPKVGKRFYASLQVVKEGE